MTSQYHTALITVDGAFWDSDKQSYFEGRFRTLIVTVTPSPSFGYFHFLLGEEKSNSLPGLRNLGCVQSFTFSNLAT